MTSLDMMNLKDAEKIFVGTRILNMFFSIHIGEICGIETRIFMMIIGMFPLIFLFTWALCGGT